MNMVVVALVVIGIVIGYVGVKLLFKQDISKMNYTQYQYVKQEDIKDFTKMCGIAVLILALSFIISGVTYLFIPNYNYIIIVVGIIIYSIILIKNQKKYNIEPQKFDNEL